MTPILGKLCSKVNHQSSIDDEIALDRQPGVAKTSLVSTRKVIKIAVSQNAKKVITDTAKELDMKEQGVASRIYEWFGRQDDLTQKHVLSLLPTGYEADLLEKALERYRQHKSQQQKGK